MLALMIYAFATTLLFAGSSILAHKSLEAVGIVRANLGRLVIGLLFLGLWSSTLGSGMRGPGLVVFILSGVAGMGIGDAAFFAALPLLGARLTIMMMQCLSVPTAILVEWLWLDTRLTPAQLISSAIVLSGIVVALMPTRNNPPRVTVRGLGAVFGVLAAVGQGVGAVLSRKGFALAAAAGTPIDGLTAAFQRLLGGFVLTVLFYAAWHSWQASRGVVPAPLATRQSGGWWWVLAHGFAGPVLGMGAFQLALAHVPSGIVLPITATTPLAVIPLTYWFEGERPSKRSLAGGALAVAGAVALTLV